MKWSERQIASFLSRVTFSNKHLLILPNCSWPGAECDLLVVTTDLRIIDVEIKISRSDLRADAGKDKWWDHLRWKPGLSEDSSAPDRRRERDWPRNVWKHYYCLPREIWTPELMFAMKPNSGIMLIDEHRDARKPFVQTERAAKPNRDAKKLIAEDAIDLARLAGIRMWHAFETMDEKVRELDDLQKLLREAMPA